jgi:hypothetical protein
MIAAILSPLESVTPGAAVLVDRSVTNHFTVNARRIAVKKALGAKEMAGRKSIARPQYIVAKG